MRLRRQCGRRQTRSRRRIRGNLWITIHERVNDWWAYWCCNTRLSAARRHIDVVIHGNSTHIGCLTLETEPLAEAPLTDERGNSALEDLILLIQSHANEFPAVIVCAPAEGTVELHCRINHYGRLFLQLIPQLSFQHSTDQPAGYVILIRSERSFPVPNRATE